MTWKSTEAGWYGHLLGDEFDDEKEPRVRAVVY